MPAEALLDVARYRVLFDDCDPMRIMYYGSYYRLFEIGWTELFRQLGHPLAAQMGRGSHLAVIEVGCRYLKPVRYDDALVIRAGLSDVAPANLTIQHQIVGPGEDVLATGRSVHVMRDQANRPLPVPAD